MKIKIAYLSFVVALLLLSCGEEHTFVADDLSAPSGTTNIKFIHAASDTVGVNLFLSDVKLTGTAPSTITTAGSVNLGKVNVGTITFTNSFPVTNYASVENASGNFTVVFPETYSATTTFSTKTLSSVAASSLKSSASYTVAFVGVTKKYETVVYEDDLSTAPLDGNVYVRFANFIENSTGNLTLKATPPATTAEPAPAAVTLFSNIAYKGMTAFVALPRPGTYSNVQIINTQTNTVVATLASTSNGFVNNKVYTIFARGRIGVTGTAAPGLTRDLNR